MRAVSENATTEPGTVGWTYNVFFFNDTATTEIYTLSLHDALPIYDGHGGTVDQLVTVTVTGTNDTPTITAGLTDAVGAVSEDATTPTLSDSGTIAFNDIDLIDLHTTSVVKASRRLGGRLTMGAVSETATTEPGTVGWTYNVANSATQYLAVGETATESLTVPVDDGHGGTVDQLVTVTVTGTNDTPTITAGLTDAVGAVSEDATTPALKSTRPNSIHEPNPNDLFSSNKDKASGTLGGTLTM